MGWGFVALGFGMAFGVGKMVLGYISAMMNPAAALAHLIIGEMNGVQFAAAIGGEFLGAFLGAVLVWLHFLPHFKTVPEPLPHDETDLLLRTRDALTPSALGIASYNTRANDVAARKRGVRSLMSALRDIKQYFSQDMHVVHEPVEGHAKLIQVALGPDEVKGITEAKELYLRRRTAQVCDLHRRLKDVDMEDFKIMLMNPAVSLRHRSKVDNGATHDGDMMRRAKSDGEYQAASQQEHSNGWFRRNNSVVGGDSGIENSNSNAVLVLDAADSDAITDNGSLLLDNAASNSAVMMGLEQGHRVEDKERTEKLEPLVVQKKQEKLDRLYDAAIIADQNAKLSIFCTRPAIFAPVFNFMCEFMCTAMLIYGALMISQQKHQLNSDLGRLFITFEGLIIGFYIFVLILGLGGPTGIAANPARDFSPRLAHFVLPIPGKGPSEFYYSWIPFFASFAGGCAAAGLYIATQLLNQSNYVETINT